MRTALLAWLASPACGADLSLVPREGASQDSGEIKEGALACVACSRRFPIVEGVPRLAEDESDLRVVKTSDRFAWEWKRYHSSLK